MLLADDLGQRLRAQAIGERGVGGRWGGGRLRFEAGEQVCHDGQIRRGEWGVTPIAVGGAVRRFARHG